MDMSIGVGWSLLHSDANISQLSAKIYTQSLGLGLPADVNKFIISDYALSNFQNHTFLAKRGPIDHPFLLKVRENEYKQAMTIFQLVGSLFLFVKCHHFSSFVTMRSAV